MKQIPWSMRAATMLVFVILIELMIAVFSGTVTDMALVAQAAKTLPRDFNCMDALQSGSTENESQASRRQRYTGYIGDAAAKGNWVTFAGLLTRCPANLLDLAAAEEKVLPSLAGATRKSLTPSQYKALVLYAEAFECEAVGSSTSWDEEALVQMFALCPDAVALKQDMPTAKAAKLETLSDIQRWLLELDQANPQIKPGPVKFDAIADEDVLHMLAFIYQNDLPESFRRFVLEKRTIQSDDQTLLEKSAFFETFKFPDRKSAMEAILFIFAHQQKDVLEELLGVNIRAKAQDKDKEKEKPSVCRAIATPTNLAKLIAARYDGSRLFFTMLDILTKACSIDSNTLYAVARDQVLQGDKFQKLIEDLEFRHAFGIVQVGSLAPTSWKSTFGAIIKPAELNQEVIDRIFGDADKVVGFYEWLETHGVVEPSARRIIARIKPTQAKTSRFEKLVLRLCRTNESDLVNSVFNRYHRLSMPGIAQTLLQATDAAVIEGLLEELNIIGPCLDPEFKPDFEELLAHAAKYKANADQFLSRWKDEEQMPPAIASAEQASMLMEIYAKEQKRDAMVSLIRHVLRKGIDMTQTKGFLHLLKSELLVMPAPPAMLPPSPLPPRKISLADMCNQSCKLESTPPRTVLCEVALGRKPKEQTVYESPNTSSDPDKISLVDRLVEFIDAKSLLPYQAVAYICNLEQNGAWFSSKAAEMLLARNLPPPPPPFTPIPTGGATSTLEDTLGRRRDDIKNESSSEDENVEFKFSD